MQEYFPGEKTKIKYIANLMFIGPCIILIDE